MIRMLTVPKWIQGLFPKRIWSGPTEDNAVYLTFDDGPHAVHTNFVLDLLKQHQAFATFFCIGKNVEANPMLYDRIINEGHSVGNHTFNHLNHAKTGNRIYLEDVKKASSFIHSRLFRPPYGRLSTFAAALLRKNKYRIIMWDVLSYDFDNRISSQQCLENVLFHAKAGSIIVFHDSEKAAPHLQKVLPEVMDFFVRKGFRLKALPAG